MNGLEDGLQAPALGMAGACEAGRRTYLNWSGVQRGAELDRTVVIGCVRKQAYEGRIQEEREGRFGHEQGGGIRQRRGGAMLDRG